MVWDEMHTQVAQGVAQGACQGHPSPMVEAIGLRLHHAQHAYKAQANDEPMPPTDVVLQQQR
jgi:hypothetical protein